jgi:hypothetical protein
MQQRQRKERKHAETECEGEISEMKEIKTRNIINTTRKQKESKEKK